MLSSARLVTRWTGRHEARLVIDGPGRGDLTERLETVLDMLLRAGAKRVVVDLRGLTGPDAEVLDLLTATCQRLWAGRGVMEARGLGHRLAPPPPVAADLLTARTMTVCRRAGAGYR